MKSCVQRTGRLGNLFDRQSNRITSYNVCYTKLLRYITGRLKDILVLSNGEKVPPMDMEMAICLDPSIDQALVVGEGRPYLSAILVLNSYNFV